MTVKELIEILKLQKQDAKVVIAESSSDWENIVLVLDDPSNPDDCKEICFAT